MTPPDAGTDDHEFAMTRRKIINSMKSLAEDEFFALVQPAQLQIPHDARQDADEHVNKNPPATESKLKGRKAQEQHVGHVDSEMEQRLDSCLAAQTLGSALDVVAAKVNGSEMPGPNDLYICVNYTRIVKSTRDSVFSQHVNKDLGESNVKIARAVLKQVDLTANPVSLAHANAAPEYQLLKISQLMKDLERPGHDHTYDDSPRTNGWHDDEEMANGIAESNGDIHREDIMQCLEVVVEGPYGVLKGDSGDIWRLYTTGLRKYLIRQEIMKIARQRVGGIGVRLIRILIDKGRLDEKLIQETGLLSAKDMRQTLSALHTMGFIELQEVPKDAQRQPNRTMYLWFYDEVRVQKALLEELYKTMARLYERLQHERGKMKPTLEKVARLGCEGREEDYMIPAEVLLLQQYQRKETWLLGEISRLDDSVALLRDL
jgi:RNA polymerase III subunit RPC82